MLAARGKHPDILEYPLSHKVDKTLKNNKRLTALDIATKNKQNQLIELLTENTFD